MLIAYSFLSLLRTFYTSFLSPTLRIPVHGTLDFNSYFQTHFGSPKPQFFSGDFLQVRALVFRMHLFSVSCTLISFCILFISYDQACQQAKRHRRLFLIYLHQLEGPESICRELFQNELFLDLVVSKIVGPFISSNMSRMNIVFFYFYLSVF